MSENMKTIRRDIIKEKKWPSPSLLNSIGCSTAEEICTGDLNGDGEVSTEDFVLLNSSFGQECSGCVEDLNGDGSVNLEDFLEFNSLFGNSCWE